MPGFTSISMYPKLWENEGLKYSELLDKYSQQKARYAGTSCYAIHETEGGIYFCNLGFNIYDNILMINIPKYDRIDLRQIAYLEEHIKIWKNGTCTLNIEKRQGKSRFEEKKF